MSVEFSSVDELLAQEQSSNIQAEEVQPQHAESAQYTEYVEIASAEGAILLGTAAVLAAFSTWAVNTKKYYK